jgi:deoxyribonuclease V
MPRALHSWDLTPKQAVALQRQLADRVRIEPLTRPVRTVAGTDCAFLDGGKRILAAAVLCDAKSMAVLAEAHAVQPCPMPYIPGLLSFREAPAVIEAVESLPETPDLVLCDGQGRAHPRRLGLASHVGLWLDLPVVGVAKSVLCGEFRQPGLARRCRTQMHHGGEVIGAAVRTRQNVRPVYVSVGHRVTLDDAIRWTLRCGRGYRLPAPARQAHLRVTRIKKQAQTP